VLGAEGRSAHHDRRCLVELITIAAAPGWYLVTRERPDAGRWHRQPLMGTAMVADGGQPFIVGLAPGEDFETVELVDEGRYWHSTMFPACRCSKPDLSAVDRAFCHRCAGEVQA